MHGRLAHAIRAICATRGPAGSGWALGLNAGACVLQQNRDMWGSGRHLALASPLGCWLTRCFLASGGEGIGRVSARGRGRPTHLDFVAKWGLVF